MTTNCNFRPIPRPQSQVLSPTFDERPCTPSPPFFNSYRIPDQPTLFSLDSEYPGSIEVYVITDNESPHVHKFSRINRNWRFKINTDASQITFATKVPTHPIFLETRVHIEKKAQKVFACVCNRQTGNFYPAMKDSSPQRDVEIFSRPYKHRELKKFGVDELENMLPKSTQCEIIYTTQLVINELGQLLPKPSK